MKTIKVVAAVICDSLENPTTIFATARGYGEFKGGWEFPGGKIEPGEAPEEAIVREIKEELDTEIIPGEMFHTVEYDYPNFHLSMDCFYAIVKKGDLVLKEAEAAKWLNSETIDTVDWLPADQELVEIIRDKLTKPLISSILLPASKSTGFVFEVKGISTNRIEEINSISTENVFEDRLSVLKEEASSVEFIKCYDDRFAINLMMVDSRMSEILANALLLSYYDGISNCTEIAVQLENENPLNFTGKGLYTHKIKEFLCAVALDMNSTDVWNESDNENVKCTFYDHEGKLKSFDIYNRTEMKDYLLNNTKFESGSSISCECGQLYTEQNGKTYLKLNLQIRLI